MTLSLMPAAGRMDRASSTVKLKSFFSLSKQLPVQADMQGPGNRCDDRAVFPHAGRTQPKRAGLWNRLFDAAAYIRIDMHNNVELRTSSNGAEVIDHVVGLLHAKAQPLVRRHDKHRALAPAS